MWHPREGAKRLNEPTALADGPTCDTQIHWRVIGGLAQKPISLEMAKHNSKIEQGSRGNLKKRFFFRPRYYATVPRSEKGAHSQHCHTKKHGGPGPQTLRSERDDKAS